MHNAAEILSNGGVALLPTDTVYGLMASPLHPAAMARIFALKGRNAAKALPLLLADTAQITALGVTLTPRSLALLNRRIGALTIVLPLKTPPAWLAGRTEIAVRMPDDARLTALLRQTGPLLATSANASGRDTPAEVADILAQLTGAPDIVVDDGPRTGQPSTLIDTQTSPFTVLRRGALSDEALAEILAL
jgi:L-threonylcarbamoyladenylate synthase